MADLSTSMGGLKLRSPIGLAALASCNWWYPSGSINKYLDYLKKVADNGIGYICTMSTGLEPEKFQNLEMRNRNWAQWEALGLKGDRTYYFVAGEGANPDIEDGLRVIEVLRKALPRDVPVVASILSLTSTAEAYGRIAKRIEAAGADAIQINAGCPLGTMEEKGAEAPAGQEYGLTLGVSEQLIRPVVKGVVDAVEIPVGVKLNPQAGYPGLMIVAKACIESGAKFLRTTHMPLCIPPPDIYNGGRPHFPLFKHADTNCIGVLGGGEAQRVPSMFYSAMVSIFMPDIDVVGGGGVTTGEEAIQAVMVGAKAVEVAAPLFWSGPAQIKRMNLFISRWMDKYGHKTIEDFRGLALKCIDPPSAAWEKAADLKLVSATDPTKCNGCGICTEIMCPARYMEDGIAKVVEEDCNCCGMCIMACPDEACYLTEGKMTIGERAKLRNRE